MKGQNRNICISWQKETNKQVERTICFRPTRLVMENLEGLQKEYPGTSRNRKINDLLAEALWNIRNENT